jgi:tRNA threonylcarbamoyladenosine biosynthesis protein TsaB
MTILALDTSMTACSVAALPLDGGPVIERFDMMQRGHAEALFPMIEAVMAEAGLDYAELTRIAVALGPGSFTGVRAGVAAARGLALAARKPLVGIGTLEIMARRCVVELPAEERAEGFAVVHDARREEVYLQCFLVDGSPVAPPCVSRLTEAPDLLPPGAPILAGSGAAALAEAGASHGRMLRARLPDLLPRAADLTCLARDREPSARPPAPLYLRQADAKPQTDKSVVRAV